jgi:hypothetical protein
VGNKRSKQLRRICRREEVRGRRCRPDQTGRKVRLRRWGSRQDSRTREKMRLIEKRIRGNVRWCSTGRV